MILLKQKLEEESVSFGKTVITYDDFFHCTPDGYIKENKFFKKHETEHIIHEVL